MRKPLLIISLTSLLLCTCPTTRGNELSASFRNQKINKISYQLARNSRLNDRGKRDLYSPSDIDELRSKKNPEFAYILSDEGPFWGNRGRRSGYDNEHFQRNSNDEFKDTIMPVWPPKGRRSGVETFLKTRGRRHLVKDILIPICEKINYDADESSNDYRNRREEEANPFWGNRGKRTESKNPFWGNRGKKDEENSPLWANEGRRHDENSPFWGNRGRRDDESAPFWGNRGKKNNGVSPFWEIRGRRDDNVLTPFWYNRGKKPDGRQSELAALFTDGQHSNDMLTFRNPFILQNSRDNEQSENDYSAPETTEAKEGSRFIRQTNSDELIRIQTEPTSIHESGKVDFQLPDKKAKKLNQIMCNLIKKKYVEDGQLMFSETTKHLNKSTPVKSYIDKNYEIIKVDSPDLENDRNSEGKVLIGKENSEILSELIRIFCT